MHQHRPGLVRRRGEMAWAGLVHGGRAARVGLRLVHGRIGGCVDDHVGPVAADGVLDGVAIGNIALRMRQPDDGKAGWRRPPHHLAPHLAAGSEHQNRAVATGHRPVPAAAAGSDLAGPDVASPSRSPS